MIDRTTEASLALTEMSSGNGNVRQDRGRRPPVDDPDNRPNPRRKRSRLKGYFTLAICALLVIGSAAAVITRSHGGSAPADPDVRYLGLYEPDSPGSYAGIDKFAKSIGRQPNIVSYYSSWLEPFQFGFADAAEAHGARTLIQMDATRVSLASIAAGGYDSYLRSYAAAVKSFGQEVVLSFGHEMNGYWYTWGNQSTPAPIFVAAWRHIVTVFRSTGATNVTWLWTVNITDLTSLIPNPAPWWPGRAYVDWVGIDGYYYSPTSTFSQVFGPTIADVRALTDDPIFIAETGVQQVAGQSAKLNDLFGGIQTFGLLGFLWYDDAYNGVDWRINSPEVFAAFRQDVTKYMRPAASSTQTP